MELGIRSYRELDLPEFINPLWTNRPPWIGCLLFLIC